MAQNSAEISTWSPDQLLERARSLEQELKAVRFQLKKITRESGALPSPGARPSSHAFHSSKYSSRLIALKFAYLGQNYNGFEHHTNNTTPLPTIEEIIWRALTKKKLIHPETYDDNPNEVNWDGCEYSKCGRTDVGVSAFGQVIGLRVRSNKPLDKEKKPSQPTLNDTATAISSQAEEEQLMPDMPAYESGVQSSEGEQQSFDDILDEIPYARELNSVLPPDIRILAWSPVSSDFSARFSCRERRYRYFFTQPAFNPTPGNPGLQQGTSKDLTGRPRREGWLDIEAMNAAAKKYEGLHDFRNLCKVDASKQIDNFMRRIFVSEIREVDSSSEPAAYIMGKEFAELEGMAGEKRVETTQTQLAHSPRVYQFVLHGTAFLWHQVRHMVAILFLVGQGLEKPSLVDELLDTTANPCRPKYEMADDAPLVLWDCIFPNEDPGSREDSLPWIWIGNESSISKRAAKGLRGGDGKFGNGGVVDELWQLWRKKKMDEILAGSLLNLAVSAGGLKPPGAHLSKRGEVSRLVYQGGNRAITKGTYVPVMKKSLLEPVEVINAKYRERKGIEPKPKRQFAETRGDHA